MLKTLQHPSLLFEPLALRLGQFTILHIRQERGNLVNHAQNKEKQRKGERCYALIWRDNIMIVSAIKFKLRDKIA